MARATRRLVLKRDDYRCTLCGATEELQVHHVVPRRLDGSNDLANLVTLCMTCHERLHLVGEPAAPDPCDTDSTSRAT